MNEELETPARSRKALSAGFIWIIVFKFLKASAFLVVGVGALRLARLPRESEPMQIARFLGANANKVLVRDLSHVLEAFTPGQVEAIGAAALVIALVFAAEGALLWMRVWWAPYFTIVLTGLGIPPEILEIARRPGSGRRYLLLAVNVAILVYLWKRRNEFRTDHSGRGPDPPPG